MFNQFFPIHTPYNPYVLPVVQPPKVPAGETTTTTSANLKPVHPYDEAIRILKKIEDDAQRLDPVVRASVLLEVVKIYKDM